MKSVARSILVFVFASLPLVACAANGSDADENTAASDNALIGGCGADRLIANAPRERRAILERAAKWIRNPVPYSMEASQDGHRTDCSGYVSMAWGRSDFTTAQVPPQDDDSGIAHRIDWSDLKPGDAVARGPYPGFEHGHIMLYAGDDYGGLFRCYWEQTTTSFFGTSISSFLKANPIEGFVPISTF